MKLTLIILAIASLVTDKCGKGISDSIPLCVQQKIEDIKKEPKWNPPAEVNEYSYNGMKVYLFSSNCCDQYNMLYDNDCKLICAPSGGITGKGDGRCNDFSSTAKFVRLVWKDPR